jgi:uncharacterized protein YfaS (alpha-2-macroglobulin family)
MDRDIEKLSGLQNYDGGFGFWHKGEESWPYISIHVAHALQVAKLKGFKVGDNTMAQAKTYLVNIESHIPDWYGIDCKRALIAYALNVRALMGDVDSHKARALVDEAGVDHLSVEAQAWLLPVMTHDPSCQAEVGKIRRFLENHVSETAGDAHYTTSYQDGAQVLLSSDRRADAVVLSAQRHVQRFAGCTEAITWSTCMPHPVYVTLPQERQRAGLHMRGPLSSGSKDISIPPGVC